MNGLLFDLFAPVVSYLFLVGVMMSSISARING